MKQIFFLLTFFLSTILLVASLTSANLIKIEFPKGENFEPGEPLIFKVTLYDNSSKPIEGQIDVTIEDSNRNIKKIFVSSKEIVTFNFEKKASSGQGKIIAKYGNVEDVAFFEIGRKELARFELYNNNLKITNIGNTLYSRIIKIKIGDVVKTKYTSLKIGESISYILVAPEGEYDIEISDGINTLIRNKIKLSGTGNVIGIIDDKSYNRNPFTGGISPEENSEIGILNYIKRNNFIYVFIAVLIASAILILIERQYRKKA